MYPQQRIDNSTATNVHSRYRSQRYTVCDTDSLDIQIQDEEGDKLDEKWALLFYYVLKEYKSLVACLSGCCFRCIKTSGDCFSRMVLHLDGKCAVRLPLTSDDNTKASSVIREGISTYYVNKR
ncbi:hypothetical protein A0H81_09399 [Grifola frondosa]|uniref:Uncharacterized protein n=1 Tax=Grifola frondosa TaxID=5627 RepID=A0A1C7M1K6_GRIFR|nr:hypothetical protein A0H81_09399 [Grifola frondosa]